MLAGWEGRDRDIDAEGVLVVVACGAAPAAEEVPDSTGAAAEEDEGAVTGVDAGGVAELVDEGATAAAVDDGTVAADEETGVTGLVPAPPPNLAAKHCAIKGTSVSPSGTSERT